MPTDLLVVVALLSLQCGNGAYIVYLGSLVTDGFSPMFLIAVTATASSLMCLPFAVVCERKDWPAKISASTWLHLAVIGLGGFVLFLELMMLGMDLTTPAITTSVLNLTPIIIFIIAAALRMEKVDSRCNYSRAKVVGSLLCFSGLTAMSLLHNGGSTPAPANSGETASYGRWTIGCLTLFAGVFTSSISMISQAKAMESIPAPVTLSVLTWMIGVATSPFLQLLFEGRIGVGTTEVGVSQLAGVIAVGGMFNAVFASTMFWCINKKGPVFVSMFCPFATISSSILSVVLFGQSLCVWSVTGIFLIFAGLYVFLWGKKNEISDGGSATPRSDIEKPLIS